MWLQSFVQFENQDIFQNQEVLKVSVKEFLFCRYFKMIIKLWKKINYLKSHLKVTTNFMMVYYLGYKLFY